MMEKCLTIATPCLKYVGIRVAMVKHFVSCHQPCIVCIKVYQYLVSKVFGTVAIPTSFLENYFYNCFTVCFFIIPDIRIRLTLCMRVSAAIYNVINLFFTLSMCVYAASYIILH